MKRKKYVSVVLIFTMLLSTLIFNYSKALALPEASLYSDALNRVINLGIMDNTQKGTKQLENYVTRGQFAKMLITSMGLQESVSNAQGPTSFGDVDASASASGYINLVAAKGLMTGLADGNFHPQDAVTYAQACTAMVKVLGYTDQDVPGLWPRNYVQKAKDLGITDGIQLSYTDKLPTWAFAVMMNNLLDTNVKAANTADAAKTYADASGLSNESYQYGLITNPVYSKPVVVHNFNANSQNIGGIKLSESVKIIRNGEVVDSSKIKENDVAYEVTDASRQKRYILVVSNQVSGIITDIQPDKISPKTLQIDSKNYPISQYMDVSKLNGTGGAFKVGQSVTALLGYDGKVVDVLQQAGLDNSNYAVVLNYTNQTVSSGKDAGKTVYTVKMLLTNGTTQTYNVDKDPTLFKGQLVFYRMIDDSTVSLAYVNKIDPKEYVIQKDDKKIGDNYIADNVRIFNIISNDSGVDAKAELINWSDVPSGKLAAGKVLFMSKVGSFQDVNFLALNDVNDDQYKLAVIDNIKVSTGRGSMSYNYTLFIDGKKYSWTECIVNAFIGNVVKVRMADGAIYSVDEVMTPDSEAAKVQAIDSTRIKINDTIYPLSNTASAYFNVPGASIDTNATDFYSFKGLADVDTHKTYGKVSVYLDKSLEYGGKIKAIVITQ